MRACFLGGNIETLFDNASNGVDIFIASFPWSFEPAIPHLKNSVSMIAQNKLDDDPAHYVEKSGDAEIIAELLPCYYV
jgi:hypothetical protein